jgi:hypothetical protein
LTIYCSACAHPVSQIVRAGNVTERRRRECENCHKVFTRHPPSASALRGESHEGRFCSRGCAADWFRRRPDLQKDLFEGVG